MDETNIHAFILDKGKFTVFDYPGAPGTQGYGMNNSDMIVGSYDSADWSTLHAYTTFDGKFVSFDAPGSTQTEFLGLNDLGQPVGCYVDATVAATCPSCSIMHNSGCSHHQALMAAWPAASTTPV